MRGPLRLLIAACFVGSLVAGCVPSLGARKPAVLSVVAVGYPGGGASPATLSLYKAALQVTKSNPSDYELNVGTISPAMADSSPGQQTPPLASALEQALGQNPPPDVVLFSSSSELATAVEKGLVTPLDDLARGERALKLDDYFPGTLAAVSDQGKLYALPLAATPLLLQYDKRQFDAAGLALPDASWNWSTLLSSARTLTKPDAEGGPQFGLNSLSTNWLMALIWQNGGDVVSQDGRRSLIGEPPAVEAIKFYSDLLRVHKVSAMRTTGQRPQPAPRVGPGEVPPLWGPGGRIAMQMVSSGVYGFGYGAYGASRGGDRPIRLAELPRGKQQATLIELQSSLAVTNASANPKVAFKALVALATEMQKEMTVPATRTAAKRLTQISANIGDDDAKVILASMEYGRALPLFRQNYYMRSINEKLVNPINAGSKEPADAAGEAAQAVDDVLNRSLEEIQATPTPAPAGQ